MRHHKRLDVTVCKHKKQTKKKKEESIRLVKEPIHFLINSTTKQN